MISKVLSELSNFVWGLPLLFLLVGAALYFNILLAFKPVTKLGLAIRLMRSRGQGKGQIPSFQALTNALAATVGMGNIAGVAVALTLGGPGALLWMWIAALLGVTLKFSETAAVMLHRGEDVYGETQGGAMYIYEQIFDGKFRWVGKSFAFLGLIGTLSLFQINQMSSYLESEYNFEPLYVGIVVAVVVFIILIGGVRRLGSFTKYVIPFMGVLYLTVGLIVILKQIDRLPIVLSSIFRGVLHPEEFIAGTGVGLLITLKNGFRRAAFSNEAGVGTAPMAHGNAQVEEPIEEALVAGIGPVFDTLMICTLTGIMILLSLDCSIIESGGGLKLVSLAFKENFGDYGKYLLSIVVFCFSFTTLVGMSNYNEKCWTYLFGKYLKNGTLFVIFYCATIIIGSVFKSNDVINLMDATYGLMALPNIIALLVLSKKIKQSSQAYFEGKKNGSSSSS